MLCTAWTGGTPALHKTHKLMTYDIAVIGGGIVGLSFAMQASERFPRLRLVVLEKEAGVARHQTDTIAGLSTAGFITRRDR